MRKLLAPFIGIAICGVLAAFSVRPELVAAAGSPGTELRFSPVNLNESRHTDGVGLRDVNPQFANIAGWISSVGASVGAADLDASGLSDEYCAVDPRDDSVTVGAVPGSQSDYPTQQLTPPTEGPAPSAPMGCMPTDLDSDGYQDVMVYYWGRSPVLFYGDGRGFTSEELVFPAQLWNSTTANVADFDGDGRPDVLVGNYFPDGARVLDPDAKHDSRMEMQEGLALARNGGSNRLYTSGEQRGQWQDHSDAIPKDASVGWTLAFGGQDLTGDLLPELYVAQDFGPDQLLVNRSVPGRPAFENVRAPRTMTQAKSSNLGHDSFKGMGVAFPYLEGSDHPSIAVSNITQPFGLQESNFLYRPQGNPGPGLLAGEANYQQVSEPYGMSRSGWAWDIRAADFNNDGTDELLQATGFVTGEKNRWPQLQELAMTNDTLVPKSKAWFNAEPGDDLSGDNRNKLFCLQPGDKYQDCAPAAGIDNPNPTRAYATLDYDGDARTDVLEANQWAASRVLRNTADVPSGLMIHPTLKSKKGGKPVAALGAKVTVKDGDSTRVQQMYPANGHTGVSSTELVFPALKQPGEAHVQWRDTSGTFHTAVVPVQQTDGHVELTLTDAGEASIR